MSKNVLIINLHGYWDFSPGTLNAAVIERMQGQLERYGYDVKTTAADADYDVEDELQKHQWADVVIHQIPVNWMGVPWKAKKYMDEVYMAGLDGRLCHGDGRSSEAPKENYGTGGTQKGKRYMLSLTFNAPREAFDNPNDWFFQGKGVDDLLWPQHLNFRFFGMEPLETFAIYDVVKNPEIEADFKRLEGHIERNFAQQMAVA